MAIPPVRVEVQPGRVVYRGPGANPFRAGDVVDLPADHAAALTASGHVLAEVDAIAARAAAARAATEAAQADAHASAEIPAPTHPATT